jgi:hypothetical protein
LNKKKIAILEEQRRYCKWQPILLAMLLVGLAKRNQNKLNATIK